MKLYAHPFIYSPDSVADKKHFSVSLDYQGSFNGSGNMLLGAKAQYLLVNIPSFSIAAGFGYHATTGEFVNNNYSTALTTIIKGNKKLHLAGTSFAFRYIFNGSKNRSYIESSLGYEYHLFKTYEGTRVGVERTTYWYVGNVSVPYTYVDTERIFINYKGTSSVKLCYGFTAKINSKLDSNFSFGIVNYRGVYSYLNNSSQTLISGIAPPGGLYYNTQDYETYFNIFAFDFSFGFQF